MHLSADDWSAIRLTLELASIVTVLLLIIGTPIAWWLARSRSPLRGVVGAVVSLPIVLPPTVLGFYLLVLMGPEGAVGRFTEALGLGRLPFTFPGLVVASILYSLHFAPRSKLKMDSLSGCFNGSRKIRPVHQLFQKMDALVA